MSSEIVIWASMLGSVILVLLLLWRRGMSDPQVILILFYLFFSFGPVVNFLMGETIYFGTKVEYIPQASITFFLATFGLFLPTWFIALDRQGFSQRCAQVSPVSSILRPANVVMSLVSLGLVAQLLLGGGGGGDKVRNIGVVGVSLHYIYLLIQLYLTSFYLNLNRSSKDKVFYFSNFALYLAYCLLVGERDFIFTLLTIMLHYPLSRSNARVPKASFILGGVVLAGLGTSIFFLRDSTQAFTSPLVAFLNQGSLLFINTFSLYLLDTGHPYFLGSTYFNSILNLLPSGLWGTGFNLLDWFKTQYAAASTSGYGYGLDAEAYVNFGWGGVFVFFIFLGLFQRFLFNAKRHGDFYLFFSVFSLGFTMYCLRNDSLALFKGHLYAIVSYLVLYFIASFIHLRKPS